jgi:hypothetical protein
MDHTAYLIVALAVIFRIFGVLNALEKRGLELYSPLIIWFQGGLVSEAVSTILLWSVFYIYPKIGRLLQLS